MTGICITFPDNIDNFLFYVEYLVAGEVMWSESFDTLEEALDYCLKIKKD